MTTLANYIHLYKKTITSNTTKDGIIEAMKEARQQRRKNLTKNKKTANTPDKIKQNIKYKSKKKYNLTEKKIQRSNYSTISY